jgi:hypothetical protein
MHYIQINHADLNRVTGTMFIENKNINKELFRLNAYGMGY